ncbi:YczE/YyaS/YitT family protein [Streptomyces sp. CB02115]|uniref:YczE/YyaS/YitT family protein n=1 Tax=Streptomyces sp. CB02115 TaxID=1703939 RepID=UPI000B27B8C6|nr:hypothetical protein [Streptomyces sp. CB02115]
MTSVSNLAMECRSRRARGSPHGTSRTHRPPLRAGSLRPTRGISFGWATNLISLLVLLAWIPLRELPGLGTILNVVIVGFAADVTAIVVPAPQGLLTQTACFALDLVALAFFDALCLGAQFGAGPRDGIMTGLVRLSRLPIAVVRTGIEVTVARAGRLLGGTVGVGTVLVALCLGPLVGFFLPRVGVRLPDAATPPARRPSRGQR